ncbi:MAG: exodeoxyribonuclease III [Mailhella sp.]|nr:exodeoxyribonuclease III [Mailhella sp.]
MSSIKLSSWNVNGIRAVSKKPDWAYFLQSGADIIALQETKVSPDQLPPEDREPAGRFAYWASSTVKKGYSGTAVISKIEPVSVEIELPDPAFGGEGRIVHLEFPRFHFFNGYFPNGGEELSKGVFKRVPYKMGFFRSFFDYAEKLRSQKPVVVCGDFNISHKEIDLARPKENMLNTGFLAEERAFLDEFTAAGYADTFRLLHPDARDAYTWWSYKTRARDRNIGWRLDYFFVSGELVPNVKEANIRSDIFGSDHCPVELVLDL